MTDMTSDMPGRQTGRRRRTLEFHIYFALIFLFALPFALVLWVVDILRLRGFSHRGPLDRAWAEANRTTPMIFSALR